MTKHTHIREVHFTTPQTELIDSVVDEMIPLKGQGQTSLVITMRGIIREALLRYEHARKDALND